MAEYFQLFNLDLQARAHYAPNDSRTHIAEQVMRSLNEATGDGRSIPLPRLPLFEGMSKDQIYGLTQDEFNALEKQRQSDISIQCAQDIANRYEGKKCMGSTIHAMTPGYSLNDCFFFDEDFVRKFHNAAPSMQNACAASNYYSKQTLFFKQHYKIYDGAIEGIRNGCQDGKVMCDMHTSVLGCEWRGPEVKRVPAPVPSTSEEEGFHYIVPNFSSDDTTDIEKSVDEYCPRVKIEEVIKEIGPLDIQSSEVVKDDGSLCRVWGDRNDTLNKMLSSVDEIVEKYTGEDLRSVVESEMHRRHKQMVKAHTTKTARASAKQKELSKSVSDIKWDELIKSGSIQKLYVSQLDMYLVGLVGYSKADILAKGFTKEKKIETIRKHFYQNQPTTKSKVQNNPNSSEISSVPQQNKVVIPWGGQVHLEDKRMTLINTCPIDNCLMIFYLMCKEMSNINNYLVNSQEQVAQILCKCLKLIDDGEYTTAKLEWIALNPAIQPSPAGILDVWDNEEELFTKHLIPFIRSYVSSSCSSPFCPLPGVSLRWANTIALRYYVLYNPNYVRNKWLACSFTFIATANLTNRYYIL